MDIGIAANRFVAVKTHSDERTRFWIARVIEVSKVDSHDKPKEIKVRWYSAKGTGNTYYAVYEPSFEVVDGHRQAHTDTIEVSTVICRFNELSSKKRLINDLNTNIRSALAKL